MRLYLDTNTIIYSIEGQPNFRDGTVRWVGHVEAAAGLLVTSRLSRLECRVQPLRNADEAKLAVYEGFFARHNLVLLDISNDVLELATDLRARYRFRTPDAIHLATAILIEADVFLSTDAALARCAEIKVLSPEAPPPSAQ